MREVSEKRFDDPEKKLNKNSSDIVDNRSMEEKQADNEKIFIDIFREDSESSQEPPKSNDFRSSIRVTDSAKETEEQESEVSSEMRLLENQYREEQRQYKEQLAELLKQKALLGENPDKQLLEKIKNRARQIVENQDLSTRKYNATKQKLNPRYKEYSKNELPRISRGIKPNKLTVQQAKEPLREKETDTSTFNTKIDGNDVEYRKDENGNEMWYINGEETASKKTTRYDIVKKETTQAYKEIAITKNGIDFPTKVRAPELDTTLEETTLLYEGKENGAITKTDVPLTNIDGEVIGKQEQSEMVRRNNDFHSTKTTNTFADTQDIVEQDTVLDGDRTTYTNSINGKPVFKMEKTPLGTVITQYNERGEEIWGFKYDKDGRPKNPKNVYPGLETIPSKINYDPDIDLNEYDNFWKIIRHGGIPQELNDRLDNSYPEMHTRNPIIKQAQAVRDKTDNVIEDRTNQGIEFDD